VGALVTDDKRVQVDRPNFTARLMSGDPDGVSEWNIVFKSPRAAIDLSSMSPDVADFIGGREVAYWLPDIEQGRVVWRHDPTVLDGDFVRAVIVRLNGRVQL
jgi:hypothetical protein